MTLTHKLKKAYQGQSVARMYMNEALRSCAISGKTLDVGGARNPDYFAYIQVASGTTIDIIDGSFSPIDFEKDALPYGDGAYNSIVFCNVLEHIFNHRFILSEMYRILSEKGVLVGFVPFLIHFHPDPHDYFRYTEESLRRLLSEAGFVDIVVTPVGKGPFLVGCNTMIQGLPSVLRPMWFLLNFVLDSVYGWRSKKSMTQRFPLGYTFSGKK